MNGGACVFCVDGVLLAWAGVADVMGLRICQ